MNIKKQFVWMPVLLVIVGILGCQKGGKKIVASAGSVKISDEDFAKELVGLPQAYRSYLATLEGKKQLLDILLREKLLLESAEKSGIDRKKEIQTSLKEYHRRAADQETEFRKGIILREYLRELQDGELKVTEPELKSYYDQNKSEFQNPKKISASHILSPTHEEAEKALARLKKGESFAKVAREVSTDPSAEKGGSIGEVSRGDLTELPEFEKELFNLKNGQISDIVKTKIGFHIIRKDGEKTLPSEGFDQAAPKIRRMLEKKKFDEWIDKIKKQKNVAIDETVLASISVQEPAPETEAPLPPAQR